MFGCKSGFPTPITAVVWNSLMMPNIKDNLLSAPTPSSFGLALLSMVRRSVCGEPAEGTVGHEIVASYDTAESHFVSTVVGPFTDNVI